MSNLAVPAQPELHYTPATATVFLFSRSWALSWQYSTATTPIWPTGSSVATADTALRKMATPTAVPHPLSLTWHFNYLSSHVMWPAAFPVEVKVGIVWDVVLCNLETFILTPLQGRTPGDKWVKSLIKPGTRLHGVTSDIYNLNIYCHHHLPHTHKHTHTSVHLSNMYINSISYLTKNTAFLPLEKLTG